MVWAVDQRIEFGSIFEEHEVAVMGAFDCDSAGLEDI
jgi:hypothetical protein